MCAYSSLTANRAELVRLICVPLMSLLIVYCVFNKMEHEVTRLVYKHLCQTPLYSGEWVGDGVGWGVTAQTTG